MKQISFKLQVFEGPLDLLLHLINKNKVNIYDIPISEITEQYIDEISEMGEYDIEVSSEFLVLAANLLYIKSKMLLPKYDETVEEEDPRLELAQRLLEYKYFKECAKILSEKEYLASHTYYKQRDYIEPRLIDESLMDITLEHLVTAIENVSERMEYRKPINPQKFSKIVGREIISVFSKVTNLIGKLKLFGKVKFRELFHGVKTRDEAVASFLAVLELLKMNQAQIIDRNGEIEIKYIKDKGKDDIGD